MDKHDFGRILDACCRKFRVEPEDVLAKNQSQNVSKCRHVCAYLMRQTGASFPAIGHELNKHHSTIIHSVQKIERQRKFFEHAIRDLEIQIDIKRRASEDWWLAL